MNSSNYNLTIYTLKNCYICNELKGKLNENKIQYDEIIIDNLLFKNSTLGDSLEKLYKTKSYPIIILSNKITSKVIISFISKTNLEEQECLFIFDNIEEVITKLKQIYEI